MRLLVLCIQVVLTVVMNIVSSALAITAIVLYSVALAQIRYIYECELPKREPDDRYYWTTASPSKKAQLDELFEIKLENYRRCEQNKHLIQVITFANFRKKIFWGIYKVQFLKQ